MTRHRRVSCSPTRRAAAATGMPFTRVMTNASNRSVKPEPGRAHGTATRRTPWSGQSMRGIRACRKAWCWKKLRWRHVFFTVSCTGQSALPHSGQAKRPPVLKSISMSSRFLSASNLASATIHGGTRPRASWNRSISRMGPPRRPFAAIVPPCSRPIKDKPSRARDPRVLDGRSPRRRLKHAAGAGGCSAGAKQKDGKGQEAYFHVLFTHSLQRRSRYLSSRQKVSIKPRNLTAEFAEWGFVGRRCYGHRAGVRFHRFWYVEHLRRWRSKAC